MLYGEQSLRALFCMFCMCLSASGGCHLVCSGVAAEGVLLEGAGMHHLSVGEMIAWIERDFLSSLVSPDGSQARGWTNVVTPVVGFATDRND